MSTWTFDVDGPLALDARLGSGRFDVEIIESGPATVDDDSGKLEVTRSGQTIIVRPPPGTVSVRARVLARIPLGSNVELSVGSADVNVASGCDEVEVAGASGDIRIGSANRVRVASASGDVRLSTVAGDASVSAASGDIIGNDVAGDLEVSLASGDVRLDHVGGDVSISTASGNIRIDRCDGSSIEIKSISGDVTLGLPTGIRVDADLRSLTGRIRIPDRDPDAPPPSRTLRLAARTTSGDITIRRA